MEKKVGDAIISFVNERHSYGEEATEDEKSRASREAKFRLFTNGFYGPKELEAYKI